MEGNVVGCRNSYETFLKGFFCTQASQPDQFYSSFRSPGVPICGPKVYCLFTVFSMLWMIRISFENWSFFRMFRLSRRTNIGYQIDTSFSQYGIYCDKTFKHSHASGDKILLPLLFLLFVSFYQNTNIIATSNHELWERLSV